jgi:hypothetical protein
MSSPEQSAYRGEIARALRGLHNLGGGKPGLDHDRGDIHNPGAPSGSSMDRISADPREERIELPFTS